MMKVAATDNLPAPAAVPAENSKSLERAAEMLRQAGRLLILAHASPDGDTIGSAFALCRALVLLGKEARVACSDPFPEKYDYITQHLYDGAGRAAVLPAADFEPELVVAVDIAAVKLLGGAMQKWLPQIRLCIDHHPSNERYAALTVLDSQAAATCEIIRRAIGLLKVEPDSYIANCIYTGLVTDTGCFRYSNTRPDTLLCAAEMMRCGARAAMISKRMFETYSPRRMEMEKLLLESLEYHYEGQVALITVSRRMCEFTGVDESDLEGVPSITSRIEGVKIGITLKEKQEGVYKISVRTNSSADASALCAEFGGGGHRAAAGCQIDGDLMDVRKKILEAAGRTLGKR